ncbi:MAG: hypothetical protein CM15mP96_1840 [Gammaproteobacteria bacterium]|nr:MAG: hypothetical protein CM15mP96_1840 [Gammaproteobacteria bacterium]
MKNKIIYLFLTALLSFNLFSNENTLRPGSGVYEFHFFNVTNPAGFVAAIETFDSSSCAEKWRNESGANVGLYSRMGGGHSHIILVAYENYDMMQKGQNIFASCAASSEMNVAFDKTSVSEDYYNYVTELVLEAGDWRLNTVFSNIEVKVKTGSQASYLEAYKLLTDSTADSFGSYGINRVVYGNKYVSHMLYNGSNSIQELNDALDEVYASNEFKSFNRKVGNIRKLVNSTLAQLVKAYPAER